MASLTFPESGYIGIAADFARPTAILRIPREFFYVDSHLYRRIHQRTLASGL